MKIFFIFMSFLIFDFMQISIIFFLIENQRLLYMSFAIKYIRELRITTHLMYDYAFE